MFKHFCRCRPMLFNLYNISLSGQYVSILPPILLSLAISPETARRLRHPQEAEKVSAERPDSAEDENDDPANQRTRRRRFHGDLEEYEAFRDKFKCSY